MYEYHTVTIIMHFKGGISLYTFVNFMSSVIYSGFPHVYNYVFKLNLTYCPISMEILIIVSILISSIVDEMMIIYNLYDNLKSRKHLNCVKSFVLSFQHMFQKCIMDQQPDDGSSVRDNCSTEASTSTKQPKKRQRKMKSPVKIRVCHCIWHDYALNVTIRICQVSNVKQKETVLCQTNNVVISKTNYKLIINLKIKKSCFPPYPVDNLSGKK